MGAPVIVYMIAVIYQQHDQLTAVLSTVYIITKPKLFQPVLRH